MKCPVKTVNRDIRPDVNWIWHVHENRVQDLPHRQRSYYPWHISIAGYYNPLYLIPEKNRNAGDGRRVWDHF